LDFTAVIIGGGSEDVKEETEGKVRNVEPRKRGTPNKHSLVAPVV
jgi:hypothetical protein